MLPVDVRAKEKLKREREELTLEIKQREDEMIEYIEEK